MKSTYLELLAKYRVDNAHPGGLNLTKNLLKREPISSNTTILDVGCGTGRTSALIAENYHCRVTAADINEEMLNIAAERFRRNNLDIRLMYANAMALPFNSRSFDMVLAESVTIFTDIPRSLREYCRVLKPRGTLLDIEMTATAPLTAYEMNEIRSVYPIRQVPTQAEWHKMFISTGFSGIQIGKVGPSGLNGHFSPGFMRDFLPHFRILSKYRWKLGYRVYRCTV